MERAMNKKRFLFALIMSVIMSLMMSFILIYSSTGFTPQFLMLWAKGFFKSYCIAFPMVLILAPLVNRLLNNH